MSHLIGIQVDQVFKRLRRNRALEGVSFDFRAGLMHGLIGPEGAGKTTLLRILAGLLSPDRGSVTYLDQGRELSFDRIRPLIAYMPQQQSLYADLSIEEHLEFFRALYGLPQDVYQRRRRELLEITRLEAFTDRPAGQLSGGMYKKLGLMCALLRSPEALLLDEPTNGVDPISRRDFWELLHELSMRRILILVTTAYMDEAERCAEVHLIEAGHAMGEGEPRQLLRREGVASFDEYFMKRAEGQPG